MRPFFPFYGSKWNIARHYPPPQKSLVIEPFAGSAAYSVFYDCSCVRLVDVDPIIVGVWDYLIHVTPSEILSLPDLPNEGDGVEGIAVPQEAKWLIGFWLNPGSSQPKRSRTALASRTDRGQLYWGPRVKNRVAAQLHLIRGWTVRLGQYHQARGFNATWFVDPPYEDKGKHYRMRFADHTALGQWCVRRLGQCIVCEGAGATWLPFTPLGSFKTLRGRASETVWIR